jgi:hypothetical protein
MSSPYDPSQQQGQPGPNPYDQPQSGQYPGGSTPAPYDQPQSGQYPGGSTPAPYGQQPYGQSYGVAPQEHPQGTIVFVLGILGIFVGVCAPIAWYLGNKALGEIRSSGASYSNGSQLRTGRMLGKVFTIIWIVFIVLYIVFVVVILGLAASQGNI